MEYVLGKEYMVMDCRAESGRIRLRNIFTVESIDDDGDVNATEDINAFFTKAELIDGWVISLGFIETLDNRFKSGNTVPVQQSRITKEEWAVLRGIIYGSN